ncbi:hypothetical protein OC861_006921 [Tilletia horrida]|nr:hypothetical protein OC861_006921 [Tilletia horrida]
MRFNFLATLSVLTAGTALAASLESRSACTSVCENASLKGTMLTRCLVKCEYCTEAGSKGYIPPSRVNCSNYCGTNRSCYDNCNAAQANCWPLGKGTTYACPDVGYMCTYLCNKQDPVDPSICISHSR